jgi:hypothetical protein
MSEPLGSDVGAKRPPRAANAAERDHHLRPFHHQIRKHAQAAATHRARAREWIWRAHIGGVPELEIAEAAGSTITQVRRIIAQIEALESADLAYTATEG